MEKCNELGKFDEAEKAKQRIIQFERLKVEKDKDNMKKFQELQMQYLEEDHQQNLENFQRKKELDEEFINKNFGELIEALREQQEAETMSAEKNFYAKYPKDPKFSSEVLNLKKITEDLAKKKEFGKAHEMQVKMNDKIAEERKIFEVQREEKLKKELVKLAKKHDNEMANIKTKAKTAMNELKATKDKEFDKWHGKKVDEEL